MNFIFEKRFLHAIDMVLHAPFFVLLYFLRRQECNSFFRLV